MTKTPALNSNEAYNPETDSRITRSGEAEVDESKTYDPSKDPRITRPTK